MAFGGVFNGKRVLVTGHAGFKGSWLSLWLNALGAKVCGYSLLPDTEFSAYREAGVGEILECEKIADIRDSEELESFFRKALPRNRVPPRSPAARAPVVLRAETHLRDERPRDAQRV